MAATLPGLLDSGDSTPYRTLVTVYQLAWCNITMDLNMQFFYLRCIPGRICCYEILQDWTSGVQCFQWIKIKAKMQDTVC